MPGTPTRLTSFPCRSNTVSWRSGGIGGTGEHNPLAVAAHAAERAGIRLRRDRRGRREHRLRTAELERPRSGLDLHRHDDAVGAEEVQLVAIAPPPDHSVAAVGRRAATCPPSPACPAAAPSGPKSHLAGFVRSIREQPAVGRQSSGNHLLVGLRGLERLAIAVDRHQIQRAPREVRRVEAQVAPVERPVSQNDWAALVRVQGFFRTRAVGGFAEDGVAAASQRDIGDESPIGRPGRRLHAFARLVRRDLDALSGGDVVDPDVLRFFVEIGLDQRNAQAVWGERWLIEEVPFGDRLKNLALAIEQGECPGVLLEGARDIAGAFRRVLLGALSRVCVLVRRTTASRRIALPRRLS